VKVTNVTVNEMFLQWWMKKQTSTLFPHQSQPFLIQDHFLNKRTNKLQKEVKNLNTTLTHYLNNRNNFLSVWALYLDSVWIPSATIDISAICLNVMAETSAHSNKNQYFLILLQAIC
jgi:hypothetical protein